MANEGLRLPVILEFERSIRNVQDFRRAVGQAFSEMAAQARSASAAGAPASSRQLTGALAQITGRAQAQILRDPGLTPSQRDELLRFSERQAQASAKVLSREHGIDVRAPSTKEIDRSRRAAERRLDKAKEQEARAAEESAKTTQQAARGNLDSSRRVDRARAAQVAALEEAGRLAHRAAVRDAAGTSLDVPRAADRLAAERDRARVTGIVAETTTPTIAAELGRTRAAERGRRNRIERAAADETRNSASLTREAALTVLARRRQQRAINQAAQAEIDGSRGTAIQRAQAYIARRTGGTPRDPTEYLTGRQLLASRVLTTASFAASGALLYGGIQFARELVKEATALQIQLSIVNSQLQNAGDTGGQSFGRIREEIIRVSKETGVMANQVALVTRQLAGAFADESGTPDFGRALTEARSAFQLGRVTGLPDQEITDSLTAITLAFEQAGESGEVIRVPFEQIGDVIVGLEQQFGVLAPEIVKFTADLAPLGAELGFTVTQLSALGAVAQQVSGRSGAVLAEQFGRILPALADRSADLLILFQENAKTAQQLPALQRALATRDLPGVLTQLVKGYENFSAAQQNTLVSLVGSRREAATFYALLARGQQTIRALNLDPDDFAGQQGKRFEEFSRSVQFSFEQAQRAIEQFGITLFEAGLGDLLRFAGEGGQVLFASLNALLSPLQAINEASDGWASKTLAIAAGLFALNKIIVVLTAAYHKYAQAQLAAAAAGFLGRGRVAAGPALTPGLPTAAGGAVPVASQVPIPFVGMTGGIAPAAGRFAASRAFLAANAPGLILMAGITAKVVRDQAQEDAAAAVDFLRQKTREALEQGIDPARIREIATRGQEDLGLAERALLVVTGQPTITDVTEREINEFYGDLRRRQLEAIRAQLGDVQLTGPGVQKSLLDPQSTQDLTEEFINSFGDDPGGPLVERAIRFIESINDPELAARIAEMQVEFEEDVKEGARRAREFAGAAERISDPNTERSIDELRVAVRTGNAVPSLLIAALQRRITDIGILIKNTQLALQGDLTDEERAETARLLQGYLDSQALLVEEVSKLGESSITGPADLRIRIRDALKLPTADSQNLADIKAVISDLEGVNPEEQLDRVFQGIELLRSIAEAAEQTTFTIPPEWRQILARAQVPAALDTEQGKRVATLLNMGLASLTKAIQDAIITVGLDANGITDVIIEGRRAMLQRALAAAYLIENAKVRLAKVTRLQGELAEVDEIAALLSVEIEGIVGGVETGGGTGYTEDKKENADDLARRIAEARLAVRRAQANGDPVQLARLAVEAADIQARFAKDEAEKIQAFAARIEALNQLRDAEAAIAQALYEVAQAQNANNAVASTDYAADAAAGAVQTAKGTEAKLRAMAAQVNADRAARDAVRDVYTAQQELLIAIANAAGDTVEAAELQLGIARDRLQALIAEGGGSAELDRARADIISAQAAVRDAKFQDQMGDIDFLLEMERISVRQAISMLEALAQMPGATEEMIRSIQRRIKQLQADVSSDLQFDLGDIRLPTFYEARRVVQAERQGIGYVDNRIITVQQTNHNAQDYQTSLDTLTDILDAPPRSGIRPRSY